MVPHKKEVVSARDVNLDEHEVWNGKLIQYFVNDIKELDEAIEVIGCPTRKK